MRFDIIMIKAIKHAVSIISKIIIGCFCGFPYLLNGEKYLVCLFGSGDTVLICGLLHEYKEMYPEKYYVLANSMHKKIIRMMVDDEDFIYLSPEQASACSYFFMFASLFFKKIVFLRPYNPIKFGDKKKGMQLEQYGILAMYKREFHLPETARFRTPCYPILDQLDEKSKRRLSEIEGNKIVIMAPATISLSCEFMRPLFEKLSKELMDAGYTVYTNGRQEDALPGTRALMLDYDEMAALSSRGGVALISARSGLCDIFAFSDFEIVVLYSSTSAFSTYSLNRLYGDRSNITEMILENRYNEEQIVAQIRKKLDGEG